MKHSVAGLCLGFCLALLLLPPLAADERSDRADKIFAPWDTTTSPGAALAVIQDGRIVYERGYGMAKIEDGLVMTPQKIFDIGSTSKQFTAACLAILIRQGKVALEDEVQKYFPEMPRYGRPLRVKHLVYHTSGIRDYNGLLELAGFRAGSDCPTVEESLEVIFRQKALNYPPGEEFSYTNSGYFLIGQLVERVSGRSLNAFAQEHIFRPLGMAHTLFQEDHTQIIANRASGYDAAAKGFTLSMSNWDETGDGNVYTSVEDLYLWDQAFYSHKLGKELMDLLHTQGTLHNGQKLDYAFGLFIGEYRGLKTVSHGGAWAGFRAGFVRFPEQKFSVVCLANLSAMDPDALCYKVADIYLAGLLKEKPGEEKKKEAAPITLPREELAACAGNYFDAKANAWAAVTLKEDRLLVSFRGLELALAPLSKTVFQALDAPVDIALEFLPDAKGKVGGVVIRVRGAERGRLAKAAPLAPLGPAQLKEYAGDYLSDELLGARYRLVAGPQGLSVRFRSLPGARLQAMARDQFDLSGMTVNFFRRGGRVAGFRLSMGRVSNILFVKR